MNILITGASGFVGRNLVTYLSGYQGFMPKPLNLRESATIADNTETVIHLAGKAHDTKNTSRPAEYYHVNYDLTRELFDAFLLSDAKKFVFISSVKAAADSVVGELTEQSTPAPKTHYGRSKLMAEEYIQSQILPNGKRYYILRPCMIHGPGNRGNLNILFNYIAKGLPYPLAAFDNRRSFLSVENLCFIIKEISERDDICSGVYNVADDEPLSTTEVVSLIADSLKKRAQILRIPKKLVELMARLGDTLKLPLNSEKLGKLTEDYVVCNEKIRAAIGKQLPVSVREGIRRTVRSLKE